jgi:hypothetical protein
MRHHIRRLYESVKYGVLFIVGLIVGHAINFVLEDDWEK